MTPFLDTESPVHYNMVAFIVAAVCFKVAVYSLGEDHYSSLSGHDRSVRSCLVVRLFRNIIQCIL